MARLILVTVPALTALVTYRRTLTGEWEFVYDDNHNFVEFLELSSANLRWYFKEAMILGVYEPLSLTLKALFVYFVGWDARAFHVLACALHALNAAVSGCLGRALMAFLRGSPELAPGVGLGCMLGASLFACQPGSVQTVCWLSCISYLLAALFAQLAVLSMLLAFRLELARSHCSAAGFLLYIICHALALACYLAALWCKAAVLPLVLIFCLLDFICLLQRYTRCCQGKTSSIVATCARGIFSLLRQVVPIGIAAFSFHKVTGGYHLEELVKLSHKETFLRACYVLLLYLWKLVDPMHDFNVMQGMPYNGIADYLQQCYACFIVLVAAAIFCISALLFGFTAMPTWRGAAGVLIASYIVMIAPGLGIHAHTSDQLYADRYLYVPAALLLPLLGGLIGEKFAACSLTSAEVQGDDGGCKGKQPLQLSGWLQGAFVGSFIVAYHVQSSATSVEHWRTNRALWKHATQVQSWNHRWWYNYAQEIADSAWPDQDEESRNQALEALNQSASLYPVVYVYIAQAEHLHSLGRFKEASRAWADALKHHSVDFEKETSHRAHQLPSEKYRILCGLGRSRLHSGKFTAAKKALGECIQQLPQHTAAVCTRRQAHAHVYARRPTLPAGVWWHQAPGERGKPGVLCAMPQCARGCLLYYKGLAHFELKEWAEGAQLFQQAYNEKYATAHTFLVWGMALYHLKSHDGARQVWWAGLKSNPAPNLLEQKQLQGNLLALDRAKAEAAAKEPSKRRSASARMTSTAHMTSTASQRSAQQEPKKQRRRRRRRKKS